MEGQNFELPDNLLNNVALGSRRCVYGSVTGASNFKCTVDDLDPAFIYIYNLYIYIIN